MDPVTGLPCRLTGACGGFGHGILGDSHVPAWALPKDTGRLFLLRVLFGLITCTGTMIMADPRLKPAVRAKLQASQWQGQDVTKLGTGLDNSLGKWTTDDERREGTYKRWLNVNQEMSDFDSPDFRFPDDGDDGFGGFGDLHWYPSGPDADVRPAVMQGGGAGGGINGAPASAGAAGSSTGSGVGGSGAGGGETPEPDPDGINRPRPSPNFPSSTDGGMFAPGQAGRFVISMTTAVCHHQL